MSNDCKYCFYNDRCSSKKVCEYYISFEDGEYDAAVDKLIEEKRIEFRKEWFRYIEENAD